MSSSSAIDDDMSDDASARDCANDARGGASNSTGGDDCGSPELMQGNQSRDQSPSDEGFSADHDSDSSSLGGEAADGLERAQPDQAPAQRTNPREIFFANKPVSEHLWKVLSSAGRLRSRAFRSMAILAGETSAASTANSRGSFNATMHAVYAIRRAPAGELPPEPVSYAAVAAEIERVVKQVLPVLDVLVQLQHDGTMYTCVLPVVDPAAVLVFLLNHPEIGRTMQFRPSDAGERENAAATAEHADSAYFRDAYNETCAHFEQARLLFDDNETTLMRLLSLGLYFDGKEVLRRGHRTVTPVSLVLLNQLHKARRSLLMAAATVAHLLPASELKAQDGSPGPDTPDFRRRAVQAQLAAILGYLPTQFCAHLTIDNVRADSPPLTRPSPDAADARHVVRHIVYVRLALLLVDLAAGAQATDLDTQGHPCLHCERAQRDFTSAFPEPDQARDCLRSQQTYQGMGGQARALVGVSHDLAVPLRNELNPLYAQATRLGLDCFGGTVPFCPLHAGDLGVAVFLIKAMMEQIGRTDVLLLELQRFSFPAHETYAALARFRNAQTLEKVWRSSAVPGYEKHGLLVALAFVCWSSWCEGHPPGGALDAGGRLTHRQQDMQGMFSPRATKESVQRIVSTMCIYTRVWRALVSGHSRNVDELVPLLQALRVGCFEIDPVAAARSEKLHYLEHIARFVHKYGAGWLMDLGGLERMHNDVTHLPHAKATKRGSLRNRHLRWLFYVRWLMLARYPGFGAPEVREHLHYSALEADMRNQTRQFGVALKGVKPSSFVAFTSVDLDAKLNGRRRGLLEFVRGIPAADAAWRREQGEMDNLLELISVQSSVIVGGSPEDSASVRLRLRAALDHMRGGQSRFDALYFVRSDTNRAEFGLLLLCAVVKDTGGQNQHLIVWEQLVPLTNGTEDATVTEWLRHDVWGHAIVLRRKPGASQFGWFLAADQSPECDLFADFRACHLVLVSLESAGLPVGADSNDYECAYAVRTIYGAQHGDDLAPPHAHPVMHNIEY